jgi:hypothetical protein
MHPPSEDWTRIQHKVVLRYTKCKYWDAGSKTFSFDVDDETAGAFVEALEAAYGEALDWLEDMQEQMTAEVLLCTYTAMRITDDTGRTPCGTLDQTQHVGVQVGIQVGVQVCIKVGRYPGR